MSESWIDGRHQNPEQVLLFQYQTCAMLVSFETEYFSDVCWTELVGLLANDDILRPSPTEKMFGVAQVDGLEACFMYYYIL